MATTLRVCLVAPSERLIGGHSVQAHQLRAALAAIRSVRITFVATDTLLPPWLRFSTRVRILRTGVRLAFFVPRLARAMRTTDVTHVFCAAYWSFAMTAGIAVVLGRVLRRPVVVNYHSGEAADHLRRQPAVAAWVLRRAQRLVVPSAYLTEVFQRVGYAPVRIPNAVDLTRFASRPRKAPYLRFLCTRSLEPCYDIPTAVRAFHLIAAVEPRALLTVVGGGSEAAALGRLIRELGLEGRVQLVGAVPHDRIAQYYRESDVYLNPAVVDNQPLSVLEAMAAGLFVVSTDVGDMRELLGDGRAGALVPPASPVEMAAAAACVIQDGRRFAAATDAAQARLADHRPSRVAQLWFACYRDVARAYNDRARIERRGPRAWLLRVRQELAKRLDALSPAPSWRGVADTVRLLALDLRLALAREDAPLQALLVRTLARRACTRYPSRQLDRRDRAAAPNRRAILEEARRLCAGAWHIFGADVAVGGKSFDWRAHPLSGQTTPAVHWHRLAYLRGECGGDVKYIWELNRHAELVRLAQAFYLTGSEEYAGRLRDLLSLWLRQNPPGVGVNWTSSLEVAIRVVAWCWIWHLTKTSAMWTGPFFAEFLWQLWHHARHVERFDSTHYSPNTHLTGEALGLFYVGTLFPEFRRARRWRERGAAILLAELDRQVLADGMHCERSTCYHRYTLEIYLHFWLLGAGGRGADRSRVRNALRRLLTATSGLCRPDQSWPVLGDEDGGRLLRLGTLDATDQRPLVVAAAAGLRRHSSIGPGDEAVLGEAWWLLGEAAWSRAARHEPNAPPTSATALRSAGYYVGRDNGHEDGWYCLVAGGVPPLGLVGHAHADVGHVEIAWGRRRLVSDPGCPTYTADLAVRNWFRSEQAHAGVSVQGSPMAVPAGAFSWRRLAPRPHAGAWDHGVVWLSEVVGARGGGNDAVHHRRQVALVRGYGVLVCDWLTGRGVRDLAWHWPLQVVPEAVALADGCAQMGDVVVQWQVVPRAVRPIAEIRESCFAPSYGRVRTGSLLVLRNTTELPTALLTLFTSDPRWCRKVTADARGIVLGLHLREGAHELEFRAYDRPVVRLRVSTAAAGERGAALVPG